MSSAEEESRSWWAGINRLKEKREWWTDLLLILDPPQEQRLKIEAKIKEIDDRLDRASETYPHV